MAGRAQEREAKISELLEVLSCDDSENISDLRINVEAQGCCMCHSHLTKKSGIPKARARDALSGPRCSETLHWTRL